MEAIRALKRHLSDVVDRRMLHNNQRARTSEAAAPVSPATADAYASNLGALVAAQ